MQQVFSCDMLLICPFSKDSLTDVFEKMKAVRRTVEHYAKKFRLIVAVVFENKKLSVEPMQDC